LGGGGGGLRGWAEERMREVLCWSGDGEHSDGVCVGMDGLDLWEWMRVEEKRRKDVR